MIASIYITCACITYVASFRYALKGMRKRVKETSLPQLYAASFLLLIPIIFGALWPIVWVFSFLLNLVNPEEKKAK